MKLSLLNGQQLKNMILIYKNETDILGILVQTVDYQLCMINFNDIKNLFNLLAKEGYHREFTQFIHFDKKDENCQSVVTVGITAYNVNLFSLIGKLTPEPMKAEPKKAEPTKASTKGRTRFSEMSDSSPEKSRMGSKLPKWSELANQPDESVAKKAKGRKGSIIQPYLLEYDRANNILFAYNNEIGGVSVYD